MMTAMKYVFHCHFSVVAQHCTRKHLDELEYPAPRTVSKLVDQVGAHPSSDRRPLLTLVRSFYSKLDSHWVGNSKKIYSNY